jgi:UDP-N-acetyl-D-mannosaminuronic acid transferase (WecB/TagA/CpsF family)
MTSSISRTAPIETEILSGAAMFMSLSTWNKLGGFRPDLFMYWEDTDFSIRARHAGVQLFVEPRAEIWHAEGGTMSSDSGMSRLYYRFNCRNRIIVLFEHRKLRKPMALAKTILRPVRPLRDETSDRALKVCAGYRGTAEGLAFICALAFGRLRAIRRRRVFGKEPKRPRQHALGFDLAYDPDKFKNVTWLNHYSIQRTNASAISTASFIGIDGSLLQVAMRACGISVKRSSADIVLPTYLTAMSELGKNVAFVGGSPGVAERAADHFAAVSICVDGYSGISSLENLARVLRARSVKAVVLGLGPDKQDFVAAALSELAPELQTLTAGGWLDQVAHSGAEYFPPLAHAIRLGWLVRVAREPRRLIRRYTIDALKFMVIAKARILGLKQLPGTWGTHSKYGYLASASIRSSREYEEVEH